MRHITKCFSKNLSRLCQEANKARQLQKTICKYIPCELRPHTKVGSFNNGCLTLSVNDVVWAAQLRFVLPELRDNLRMQEKLYELTNIKITIERQVTPIPIAKKTKKPSSPWKEILNKLQGTDL